ncbi:hypothetical protein MTP99_011016 [Tenebrio molitor]|nr:hypothetical protein MTP99_011016 [Tenebrio molitor]
MSSIAIIYQIQIVRLQEKIFHLETNQNQNEQKTNKKSTATDDIVCDGNMEIPCLLMNVSKRTYLTVIPVTCGCKFHFFVDMQQIAGNQAINGHWLKQKKIW